MRGCAVSKIHQADEQRFVFRCPGCGEAHMIKVPVWSFDGNFERPTISPSIKATNPNSEPSFVCHSFVRNGQIEFLGDCTHSLAGKTVDLPEWPEGWS